MVRSTLLILICFSIPFVGISHVYATGPQASIERASIVPSPYRTILDKYCVTCHNERLKTAGLMLDHIDAGDVTSWPDIWEKVVRKLRTRAMPPPGMPRPDEEVYNSLINYLEVRLDQGAAAKPNPGRPVAHRLNRAEFANAVRDILGIPIDVESLLPADEMGYGFDNMADILSVSPVLMERYMSAAEKISGLAIPDSSMRPVEEVYDVPQNFAQQDQVSEDLPFGSRGGIAIRHYFPLTAEYAVEVRLQRKFSSQRIIGIDRRKQVEFRLDGARIKLFSIGGEGNGNSENTGQENEQKRDDHGEDAALEVRVRVDAGMHLVGVTFVKDTVAPEGIVQKNGTDYLARLGVIPLDETDDFIHEGVAKVTISGPFKAKEEGKEPSRLAGILTCHPTGEAAEALCAKNILSTLAKRAYRRPVTNADIQPLLSLYEAGHASGGLEGGIRLALRGMLVSPWFLYRIEYDRNDVPPGTAYRINDMELASRLSFFLWSSIPDEQLSALAEAGKLREPEILEHEVKRMLFDPRSDSLVNNFAGLWLGFRGLRSASPDPTKFPDFDANLRDAFQEEMKLFFESLLKEDRSALDLLNANYTFVNERLARHYGIPNIYGPRFRRVTLKDEKRWGLLGKGSFLMTTSYPTRTAPTLRGKWVLENILGTPPPPPPPNVPSLKDNKDTKALTMRQRMEQHRANPACAGCHSRMDPLGFALDNFDATGKWRTMNEGGTPIDASGTLPDGTKFQGPVELRKILTKDYEQFCTTVTEKLLAYALGRGVEYYDQPAVRRIVREAAAVDYRWSALVLGVIKSTPFQMRRSREP